MTTASGSDSSRNEDVVVTGATGLVGSALLPHLVPRFAGIRILSRSVNGPPTNSARLFSWDGVHPSPESLAGSDAIVHLAGEPIFAGLPTGSHRERIRKSRIDSTRALVDCMSSLEEAERPSTLVCASAVGIYGDRGEEILDESSVPGTGFLADVCRDWEDEARRAESAGVRVVSVRMGVVISRAGGALAQMRAPFSLGLGGRLGSGRQFFPWIHLDDLVRVILWALDSSAEGPINAVAPTETRNGDLARALGRVLHRPALLPVPAFALKAALGELAGELLGSRRVAPARLEADGFEFRYPSIDDALEAEFG